MCGLKTGIYREMTFPMARELVSIPKLKRILPNTAHLDHLIGCMEYAKVTIPKSTRRWLKQPIAVKGNGDGPWAHIGPFKKPKFDLFLENGTFISFHEVMEEELNGTSCIVIMFSVVGPKVTLERVHL